MTHATMKSHPQSCARPRWVWRMVRLARIKLAKAAVKIVLPRGLFIGKHLGAYTQKWSVHLGKIDSRGVLQGVEDRKA